MKPLIAILLLAACGFLSAAGIEVAALHPLLGDLARHVGGNRVTVVDLMQPGSNLHHFEPTAKEMATAVGAQLVLATGKNMEPYLRRLRDALPSGARVVELGDAVPDAAVPANVHKHDAECGEHHSEDCCDHGPNDPHWWHTPANMKRAARRLAAVLVETDPGHAEEYRARAREWNREMDELDAEARVALDTIPPEQRILVTGHASMCHFCEAYGFVPIAAQGISMQDEGHASGLADLLVRLRACGAKAIFTEINASPKMLDTIAEQLGIPTFPLITDGNDAARRDFASMFRYNVAAIVRGLAPQQLR